MKNLKKTIDLNIFHFFALWVDSPLFIPLGGVRGKGREKRKNEMFLSIFLVLQV